MREYSRRLMATLVCLALVGQNASAAVTATDRKAVKEQQKLLKFQGDKGPHTKATGSISLIDSSGLQYFVNTNITFSTTSSASGAASEASFTAPLVASTSAGGTTTSTLNDAFDGSNALCVSLANATGPCATGNPSYSFYNQNGAASFDVSPECSGGANVVNRQIVFPAKTIGPLSVQRKVYVPTDDNFIRHQNIFTNTSGAPVTFTAIIANNLGSDSNTRVVNTSGGTPTATTASLWVSSFQNFSGSTSSDPRLVFALQANGAPTPLSIINFVDGDDNPYWGYSITLAPGEKKIIANFAAALGTKTAANAKGADLTGGTNPNQWNCMSTADRSSVVNFSKAGQVIVFGSAPTVLVGGTGTVSATGGGSGNPVTFASSTPAVCTISGTTVTGVSGGNCTITADQAGNGVFDPAPQATQTFAIGKLDQTISFGGAPLVVTGSTGTLSATGGGSGNPIIFASGTPGVCTVSGNTVTVLSAGICTVTANQAGNANYNAAAQASQSFSSVAIVPTLSELGLGILGLAFLGTGMYFQRRRKTY